MTGRIRLRHTGAGSRTVGAVLSAAVIAASCVLGPSAAFGEEPLPSPTPTVVETPATPGPESPAPDATAAPVVTPTPEPTAPVEDTPPEGTPVIGLSGTLFVAVSEGNPDTSLDSPSADAAGSETTYSVQTDDGVFVQIENDVPADAASGDQFEGTVALPAEVIDAIPNADAAEITNSADPLPADSDAAVVAQAAASDLGTVLATSAVTISPALTLPSNTVSHKLYIAVVTPAGLGAPAFDQPGTLSSLTTYVTNYWRTQSEGDIPAFTTNATVLQYTSAFGCDASIGPNQRWTEAETKFFSAPGAMPDNAGNHLAVLLPASCQDGAGIGWGTVGNGPNFGGYVQVVVGAGVDNSVLAHEIGHNLGLNHSNLDWCGANNATAGCTNFEYWDIYDVMGLSINGVSAVTTLNGATKVALGFVEGASLGQASLPSGQLTSSSTFNLKALDSLAGLQVIEVVDPITSQSYYLEYRAGTNSDLGAIYTDGNTIRDINYPSGNWVGFGSGVRILKQTTEAGSPGIGSTAITRWIADPTSPYASQVLGVGESYAIPGTGVTVTFTSGTPASGASVTVAFSVPDPVPTQNFVKQVYLDFLGRAATTDELASATSRLMSNQLSRFQFANELSLSDEWITTVITGFYRNTLNREPDAAGLRGWINAAQGGMPVAQIASAFYASPEYFRNVGLSDYRTWVTDLYLKLLLRAPDAGGLDGWVAALEGGMARDTLVFGFYQSKETLQVRVNTLYQKFLGRNGEPAGIANWVPFVKTQGDLVLAAALAGSKEYFNRAQTLATP